MSPISPGTGVLLVTSPGGFALIVLCAFMVHVAASAELLLEPGHRAPSAVKWLVRNRPRRTSLLRVITVPLLIGIQLLVATAIVQPNRVAGTAGVAIAVVELAASVLWLSLLYRWRRGT